MSKKTDRLRRAKKTRERIKRTGADRLCVHKTPRHVYAQVISSNTSQVLASASSLDKEVRSHIKYSGNMEAATIVGGILAERAKKQVLKKLLLIVQDLNSMVVFRHLLMRHVKMD